MAYKGTKGTFIKDNDLIFVDDYYQTHVANIPSSFDEKIREEHGKLIIDAFQTASDTGLLPSEIIKERDELLRWKKEAMMVFDPIDKFFEDRNAPLGVSKIDFLVKIAGQRDEAVEMLKLVVMTPAFEQAKKDYGGHPNHWTSQIEKFIKSITESK